MLLTHLPAVRQNALDVGCGYGDYAVRLSPFFKTVYAIDPDLPSVERAKSSNSQNTNILFINESFLSYNFSSIKFDYISMLASLHHMDIYEAINRAIGLLSPSGYLSILGLYRETVFDLPSSIYSIFLHSYYKKKYRCQNDDDGMVISKPKETYYNICKVMNEILPGSSIRKLPLWRYFILWEKTVIHNVV